MTAKHARRLELYRQGLSDKEIAEAEGIPRQVISTWRNNYHLPNNGTRFYDAHACHMREALPDEGCELVLRFFARVLALDDMRRKAVRT